MSDLEIQVFPQTEEALKNNLPIRCVLRTKYRGEKSRRSAVVIPWAQSVTEKVSSAAIQKVGLQTAGFSVQLIMIQLLDSRDTVHICYDLGLRADISGKYDTKQPIHLVTRRHKVFFMQRDERLDARAFEQYLHMSGNDKGPPCFRIADTLLFTQWGGA